MNDKLSPELEALLESVVCGERGAVDAEVVEACRLHPGFADRLTEVLQIAESVESMAADTRDDLRRAETLREAPGTGSVAAILDAADPMPPPHESPRRLTTLRAAGFLAAAAALLLAASVLWRGAERAEPAGPIMLSGSGGLELELPADGPWAGTEVRWTSKLPRGTLFDLRVFDADPSVGAAPLESVTGLESPPWMLQDETTKRLREAGGAWIEIQAVGSLMTPEPHGLGFVPL